MLRNEVFTAPKRARYGIELQIAPEWGREEAEMAEERQEGQELLLPPFFVGRMLSILPTPNFALQSWGFVAQDGARRPGIEMHILMEPPSGDSIKIKIIFWGTGAPQKITFFSDTSSTEVSVIYLREDPWGFIEKLWELYVALRY